MNTVSIKNLHYTWEHSTSKEQSLSNQTLVMTASSANWEYALKLWQSKMPGPKYILEVLIWVKISETNAFMLSNQIMSSVIIIPEKAIVIAKTWNLGWFFHKAFSMRGTIYLIFKFISVFQKNVFLSNSKNLYYSLYNTGSHRSEMKPRKIVINDLEKKIGFFYFF